jgi:hypothetical protein
MVCFSVPTAKKKSHHSLPNGGWGDVQPKEKYSEGTPTKSSGK